VVHKHRANIPTGISETGELPIDHLQSGCPPWGRFRQDEPIIPFTIIVDKRFAPPILAEFIEALPKLHSVLDDLDELDVGATDIPEHAETGTVDGEDPGG